MRQYMNMPLLCPSCGQETIGSGQVFSTYVELCKLCVQECLNTKCRTQAVVLWPSAFFDHDYFPRDSQWPSEGPKVPIVIYPSPEGWRNPDEHWQKHVPPSLSKILKEASLVITKSSDAAVLYIRAILEGILKSRGFKGNTLNELIDDFTANGNLTREKNHFPGTIRLSGNDVAHRIEVLLKKEEYPSLYDSNTANVLFLLLTEVVYSIYVEPKISAEFAAQIANYSKNLKAT